MPQTPYNAPVGQSYAHISAAGTVTVKSAPGLLVGFSVNAVPAAADTVTIVDDITNVGTHAVGVVSLGTTTPLGMVKFGEQGVQLSRGLTVVTTGTVDLTFIYR